MSWWENSSAAVRRVGCLVLIICGLFFFAGGLSAGIIGVRGINEGGITALTRHNARFIRPERHPAYFWFTVSCHGVFAVGFCGVGGWVIRYAVRRWP
jgi:hypothetical protein